MTLRVVHLDTAMELRGGQRQLIMLARGLRDLGHLQHIVCPAGSRLCALAREEGFATLGLRHHGFWSAGELRALLHAGSFDVIHAHDGRGQSLAWLASITGTARRVASRRVTFVPRGTLVHRLKYSLTCDGVIAVSEFVRRLLLGAGVPAEKIGVIPDGIDFPESPPNPAARAEARAQFGLAEDEFVIGHAGAFTPEKGQEIAIEAFRRVAPEMPGARLLLAGAGRLLPTLVEKYGLRDSAGPIRLVGYLDDLSPFMNSLDLFVMPSLAEGLGSSALIAMAHGVPVIASRAGGLPEIVTEGENGWLVEAGSPGSLAEAIVAAASRPEQRCDAGRRGRERARLFTNDIMGRKTEAFYRRLLG
ncbi:MAG: glycosyltransferase family 4 protein [Terriglobia bacterium]